VGSGLDSDVALASGSTETTVKGVAVMVGRGVRVTVGVTVYAGGSVGAA